VVSSVDLAPSPFDAFRASELHYIKANIWAEHSAHMEKMRSWKLTRGDMTGDLVVDGSTV
jgi:hypothetical protein